MLKWQMKKIIITLLCIVSYATASQRVVFSDKNSKISLEYTHDLVVERHFDISCKDIGGGRRKYICECVDKNSTTIQLPSKKYSQKFSFEQWACDESFSYIKADLVAEFKASCREQVREYITDDCHSIAVFNQRHIFFVKKRERTNSDINFENVLDARWITSDQLDLLVLKKQNQNGVNMRNFEIFTYSLEQKQTSVKALIENSAQNRIKAVALLKEFAVCLVCDDDQNKGLQTFIELQHLKSKQRYPIYDLSDCLKNPRAQLLLRAPRIMVYEDRQNNTLDKIVITGYQDIWNKPVEMTIDLLQDIVLDEESLSTKTLQGDLLQSKKTALLYDLLCKNMQIKKNYCYAFLLIFAPIIFYYSLKDLVVNDRRISLTF